MPETIPSLKRKDTIAALLRLMEIVTKEEGERAREVLKELEAIEELPE